jgi:hypothetical protein
MVDTRFLDRHRHETIEHEGGYAILCLRTFSIPVRLPDLQEHAGCGLMGWPARRQRARS